MKIGSIFVEVRGDYSKFKEDLQALKITAAKDGKEISDALNNAISPKQAESAINKLNRQLMELSRSAKVPADSFKITTDAIAKNLGDVAQKAGLSEKEFAKLNERMLQTQASKNAEKALNDIAKAAGLSENEMKKLGHQLGLTDKQMGQHSATVSQSHQGWAMFTAGVASAIYILRNVGMVVSGLAAPFKAAYMATEEFNMSVVRMASIITTFQKLKPGQDLAEGYKQSKDYALALAEALERMAPKVFGSAKDLMMITEEFAKQGVLLDINNKKEMDNFANIANAVGVIAAGYSNREMQIRQESRALMEGVVKPTNVLAGQIQQMVDGPLKEKLAIWKEEGTVIQNVGLLLKGYSAATDDIEGTWESIKTTLETIYKVILREGLGGIYKEINEALLKMNVYLMDNKENIVKPLKELWITISKTIGDINFVNYIKAAEGALMMLKDFTKALTENYTIQDKQNKVSEEFISNLKRIT